MTNRALRARRAHVSGRMKRTTTTTTKHGVRSPWGQRCTTNSENTPRTTRIAGACRGRTAASAPMPLTATSPKAPQRIKHAPALHARTFPRGTTMPRRANALQDAPYPIPLRAREDVPPTQGTFPRKTATASATAHRQVQGRGRVGRATPPAARGAVRKSTPPRPPTKITTAICASRRSPSAPAGDLRACSPAWAWWPPSSSAWCCSCRACPPTSR